MISGRQFAVENLDPRFRAGLIGHWIGGGSGPSWIDRTGWSNSAVITGALWGLSANGSRYGLQFDGVDDFADTPLTSLFSPGNGDFTVFFRIKSTDTTGNVLSQTISTAGTWALVFFASDLYWQTTHGYTNLYSRPASSVLDGTWHTVAVTRLGTVNTMYFDGAQQGATVADSTNYNQTSVLRFCFGANGFLAATMDDVRIYNKALSSGELSAMSRASYSPVVIPVRPKR